jgi:dihydropteroate synthase
MHTLEEAQQLSRVVWPQYGRRAVCWKLRTQRLLFGKQPRLMGIVNVTPDSFSDGGQFLETQKAVEHGLALAEQGADIIDVGGESTRPYSERVDEKEELRRVLPVIARLRDNTKTPLSIDTSKARVAREAVAAGVEIINDVTGLEGDQEMLAVAQDTGAAVCAMHMQGTPRTMQNNPQYVEVVADIERYLKQRRDVLLDSGIAAERVCVDPGIGFGKTHQHNLNLLARCGQFHSLGCTLLVGPSRKGFIAKLLGNDQTARTAGTIGAALALARQGVQVIRVHDVTAIRQTLRMFEACGGIDGQPGTVD